MKTKFVIKFSKRISEKRKMKSQNSERRELKKEKFSIQFNFYIQMINLSLSSSQLDNEILLEVPERH